MQTDPYCTSSRFTFSALSPSLSVRPTGLTFADELDYLLAAVDVVSL